MECAYVIFISNFGDGVAYTKEKSIPLYLYHSPSTYCMLFVSHQESNNHSLCIHLSRKNQCMENILTANRT